MGKHNRKHHDGDHGKDCGCGCGAKFGYCHRPNICKTGCHDTRKPYVDYMQCPRRQRCNPCQQWGHDGRGKRGCACDGDHHDDHHGDHHDKHHGKKDCGCGCGGKKNKKDKKCKKDKHHDKKDCGCGCGGKKDCCTLPYPYPCGPLGLGNVQGYTFARNFAANSVNAGGIHWQ